MRRARLLLLLSFAAAIAAPARAGGPSIAPEQAATSAAAAPAGDTDVMPTKWSLLPPGAPQAGAKPGMRKPAAKAAADRKPRIYGGARMSSARNNRVRSGAQVGVKLPF
jgi:hypothetical protein